MKKIEIEDMTFVVGENQQGGYVGKAIGLFIVCEAENIEELKQSILTDLRKYYEEKLIRGSLRKLIRLHLNIPNGESISEISYLSNDDDTIVWIRKLENGFASINHGGYFEKNKNYINFDLDKITEQKDILIYTYRPLLSKEAFFQGTSNSLLFGFYFKKFTLHIGQNRYENKFCLTLSRSINGPDDINIIIKDFEEVSIPNFSSSGKFSSSVNVALSYFRENPCENLIEIIQSKLCGLSDIIQYNSLSSRLVDYFNKSNFNRYHEGINRVGKDNEFRGEIECVLCKSKNYFTDYISYLFRQLLKGKILKEIDNVVWIYIGSSYDYSPPFSKKITKENDQDLRSKFLSEISATYNFANHYLFIIENWERYKLMQVQ